MKIYAVHNNTGSRYYRLIPQLKEMQRRGHEVRIENHDDQKMQQNIEWCDVVIFQMIFSERYVREAKRLGKRVVMEIDDLLHTTPKTHYAYKETSGFKKVRWLWELFRHLRLIDALIVTNENLKNVYGWMAPKCFVYDNYLDLEHWIREKKNNNTQRIRMLWAGSTSHTGDLQMARPALKYILEKYPLVQFIYIGHGGIKSKDLTARFLYGEDIFSGLPDNRESMLSVPAYAWPYALSTLLADFAIAPLEKNYFNKFKSQCKYLEYSANKIPAVYSSWFYKDVKNGETGLTAGTTEEWIHAIERMIADPFMRERMGNAAYDDVMIRMDSRKHVGKWADFIESLGQK